MVQLAHGRGESAFHKPHPLQELACKAATPLGHDSFLLGDAACMHALLFITSLLCVGSRHQLAVGVLF